MQHAQILLLRRFGARQIQRLFLHSMHAYAGRLDFCHLRL